MSDFEKDETLPDGTIVGNRFKIIQKLGEGGCGSVFKVEDLENQNQPCAMKVEYNTTTNGNVLKMEVQILQALTTKKHVAKLIFSGKKTEFCYMVMTLLGDSLSSLISKHGPYFNVSTQTRIGISLLFGVKQIHDSGYIHRDLKPANIALGYKGSEDERYFLVLDFGLARKYVSEVEGKLALRRPRERALFRGTARYCSMAMHEREDQGRVDDLWAMMYILAELRCKLPWADFGEKQDILASKKKTADDVLFSKSPLQLLEFATEVRKLNYYDRPDYEKLFNILNDIMKQADFKWSDPYHWEPQVKLSAEKRKQSREPEKPEKIPDKKTGSTRRKAVVVAQVHSSSDKQRKSSRSRRNKKKGNKDEADKKATTPVDKKKNMSADATASSDAPYFASDDFTSNPIGF